MGCSGTAVFDDAPLEDSADARDSSTASAALRKGRSASARTGQISADNDWRPLDYMHWDQLLQRSNANTQPNPMFC
jgi:hypothetical protein